MKIIEFYRKNLCDYVIIKKYYKEPIKIMFFLYLIVFILYALIVWLINIRMNRANTFFHDMLFSICLVSFFLILIPFFLKLKIHFNRANLKAVEILCKEFSLPSYHIRTSKYNKIRKIILDKKLDELNLNTKEKLNAILSKIRFEYIDKRISKTKRNYVFSVVGASLFTSYITRYIDQFKAMLTEAAFIFTNRLQIYSFNSIAVIGAVILLFSFNSAFNMTVSAFDDVDKLRKYSYLIELEEIINEKINEIINEIINDME